MANNNESTMKWKVDITQLKAAMQEAKRAINQANAEFKTATAGMDKWSKSTEGLEAKLQQLNKQLPAQKRQLEVLEAEYNRTVKTMGEGSSAAADLKIKIEEQKAAITKTETSIDKYNGQLGDMKAKQAESESATGKLSKTIAEQEAKLADLKKAYKNAVLQYGENSKEAKDLAKQIQNLSGELNDNKKKMADLDKAADNLDGSLEEIDKSAKDAANGGFTVLKGAMANLVSKGIEKVITGLKNLGKKMFEIGKESINSYANYEQLVGGVETLFKESSKIVEGYANNAYKTAGLSANQYMETVTSFSASLLQGLNGDTAEAAKIADMAITDMSDNANKMGTDIASLQYAYQGFAKGNFTMLDNLKLGYGGTKTEMLRLVKDAGLVNDSVKSIDDVSFDTIIKAIHKVQDEIGITGTTSKEAADTIEGSKNAMKSSWENLLTEMAKSDGNVKAAFDTFIKAVKTYGKNILPRIKTLINNFMAFVRSEMQKRAPKLLSFIDTVKDVIGKAVEVFKDFFGWIIDHGDTVIAILAGIGTALLAFKVVTLISSAIGIFTKFFAVIKAGTGIMAAFNAVGMANPIALITAAVVGLIAAFVVLWNKSEKFRQFFIDMWENIKEVASAVWEAITGFFSAAWDKIKEIWSVVADWFSGIWDAISGAAQACWDAIKAVWDTVSGWFQTVFGPVIDFFETAFHNIYVIAKGCWEIIKKVWEIVSAWFNEHVIQPVKNFFTQLWDGIKNAAKAAWDAIKGVWNAVSGWFNDKVIAPVKNFFKGMWDGLKNGAKAAWEGIKSVFTPVVDWFKNVFSKAWQAVKNVFSTGGKIFEGIKEGIVSAFKAVVNAIIRGINKVIAIPFNAINAVLSKIRDISILGITPFSWIKTFSVPQIPQLAKGGVLKRGQLGLLEGNGAEAVVPLEKNRQWIAAVVKGMVEEMNISGMKGMLGGQLAAMNGKAAAYGSMTQNVTFNQTINSPKAVDRLTLYRDTNSLLFSAKVGLGNV